MTHAHAVPRFQTTEDAVALIRHTLTVFNIPTSPAPPPRLFSYTAGLSSENVRRQATFFRIVSITEATLDTMSMELIRPEVDWINRTQRRLAADFEIGSTASWQRREAAFKKLHGVSLPKLDSWRELQAAIQVRNSIAHGLGRLTGRQRENSGLASHVAILDISAAGGRLYLSGRSVTLTADANISFLLSLDGALP